MRVPDDDPATGREDDARPPSGSTARIDRHMPAVDTDEARRRLDLPLRRAPRPG